MVSQQRLHWPWLPLKMEGGRDHKPRPPEAGKGKEMGSHLELPEGKEACGPILDV
jgi:hypothetical protein